MLLRKSVLNSWLKILEKYVRRGSFYSNVAGFRSATLLKMNLFTSIFQVFTWLPLRKSIFTEISVAACFLKILSYNYGTRNPGNVKIICKNE